MTHACTKGVHHHLDQRISTLTETSPTRSPLIRMKAFPFSSGMTLRRASAESLSSGTQRTYSIHTSQLHVLTALEALETLMDAAGGSLFVMHNEALCNQQPARSRPQDEHFQHSFWSSYGFSRQWTRLDRSACNGLSTSFAYTVKPCTRLHSVGSIDLPGKYL